MTKISEANLERKGIIEEILGEEKSKTTTNEESRVELERQQKGFRLQIIRLGGVLSSSSGPNSYTFRITANGRIIRGNTENAGARASGQNFQRIEKLKSHIQMIDKALKVFMESLN